MGVRQLAAAMASQLAGKVSRQLALPTGLPMEQAPSATRSGGLRSAAAHGEPISGSKPLPIVPFMGLGDSDRPSLFD